MSEVPADASSKLPRTRRRLWIVAGGVAVAAFFYFVVDVFVAYTEDAYVRSDFVEVASEVSGIVDHVEVLNDQKVVVGTPLAVIDPKPFELTVELAQKRVGQASSSAQVKQDEAGVLAAELDAAKAAVTLAQREYERAATLVKDQTVSQEIMDQATDQRQKALDGLAGVEARVRVNAGATAATLADVAVATAQLNLAQYNLSRTRIVAPVSGYVTNLSLRPGAYARMGDPILGLVDDSQWRVVANFKEYVASRLTPGMRAWVWLDSRPWRFFPARVVGVGRGISREQDRARLLPYVAPTTDWIRLARRMQVTLELEPAPDVPLFMGADARVLLLP